MARTNLSTNTPIKDTSADTSAQVIEQIRQRAYELYETRGREDGHQLDDWLQAEGEILGVQHKAAAA